MAQHKHFLKWVCDYCGCTSTTYLATQENVVRLEAIFAEGLQLCIGTPPSRVCWECMQEHYSLYEKAARDRAYRWTAENEQEPVDALPEKSASTGSVPVASGWSAPEPEHLQHSFKRSVPVKKTALPSVDKVCHYCGQDGPRLLPQRALNEPRHRSICQTCRDTIEVGR